MAGAGFAVGGSAVDRFAVAFDVIAFSMCLMALLKLLQDMERFSTMFRNYDLLARSFVIYAHVYPFAELLAGRIGGCGPAP
ncbi:hypothetical protein GmRootV213_06600 [Variovorax sp. V213]